MQARHRHRTARRVGCSSHMDGKFEIHLPGLEHLPSSKIAKSISNSLNQSVSICFQFALLRFLNQSRMEHVHKTLAHNLLSTSNMKCKAHTHTLSKHSLYKSHIFSRCHKIIKSPFQVTIKTFQVTIKKTHQTYQESMRSGLVASMVLLWEFQSKPGPATRMQWYSMLSDPKHNYLP